MKKRGFGVGVYNECGRKVARDETIEEGLVPELHEEAGIKTSVLKPVGVPTFGYNAWSTGNITDEIIRKYLEHYRNSGNNDTSTIFLE